ncbi:hypothetical protein JKF63_01639 [Porcisia hertigi]|uniref:Uncharacterized protein n=1 Tax=Porcisia hertigi TaxID=2761500 RepID=A0A836L1I9_9TRYP|nr:hypothetical protein JKF63_01639 [Porcisia hertigi]
MPTGVYTSAQFSRHLCSILRRHPSATRLRLQLLPPAAELHSPPVSSHVQGGKPDVVGLQSMEDSGADFITLYAVVLQCDRDGGDEKCVATYTVVGHISHISIHWCAQLQRSLSVTSLLASPTRSCLWHSNSFHESGLGSIPKDESVGAISSFQVQLSPYVPPLQWCRAQDGVFGSHHLICGSYTCIIDETREDDDIRASAARTCEWWEEEDDLQRPPSKAAAVAVITHAAQDTPSLGPPVRKPRRERGPPTLAVAAAEEMPSCSSTFSNVHLPLRLAAVLNGSVPLDSASASIPGVRVLCLTALNGEFLTGGTPPDSPSLLRQQDLFDTVGDFMSQEVMPRVSLRLIDGTWAHAEASARLLDDVCQVRQVLGTSYVAQYPLDAAAPGAARARSIVMVLDLSMPLQELLSTIPSIRSSLQASKTNGKAKQRQRCLAAQVAEAVQDTIGQLVSQHPDVFTFTCGDTTTMKSTPVVQPPRRLTHLTCDMYCRSIAASVAHIFSLSPHAAFTEEVVRLLWGSTKADEDTDTTPDKGSSHESRRASQRQPTQIQRRIEERLMSAIPP